MNVATILTTARQDITRSIEIKVKDKDGKVSTRKTRIWTSGPPNQGRYGVGVALIKAGGWTENTVQAFNLMRKVTGSKSLAAWETANTFEDMREALIVAFKEVA